MSVQQVVCMAVASVASDKRYFGIHSIPLLAVCERLVNGMLSEEAPITFNRATLLAPAGCFLVPDLQ